MVCTFLSTIFIQQIPDMHTTHIKDFLLTVYCGNGDFNVLSLSPFNHTQANKIPYSPWTQTPLFGSVFLL